MESHNPCAIKSNNKASQCLCAKIPNSWVGCILIQIRAMNGAKVQTLTLGFIPFVTEIIITGCKSLISFPNLAVLMIPSRSPCLYRSCLQQERHTCQHESEKVSWSNANKKHSINHHLGDKLVCDVCVWAGSRLVPCISIYITHKPGISSIKFLLR